MIMSLWLVGGSDDHEVVVGKVWQRLMIIASLCQPLPTTNP